MTKIIIIRGNSGSGKTTLAQTLHDQCDSSFLISQDVVRRQMLQVDDHAGNLAINLMAELIEFGRLHVDVVILEGILRQDVYRELLQSVLTKFDIVIPVYYDLPLTETISRHRTKRFVSFTESDVAKWYRKNDYLGWPDEIIFNQTITLKQAIAAIMQRINHQ